MQHLHHPCTKTAPWRQGAQFRGATRRAKRPRVKKEAVKKSLDRKRTLHRSSHRHDRIACRGRALRHLPWRRTGTKIKLHLHGGPR